MKTAASLLTGAEQLASLQSDRETLLLIVAGLDRLETLWVHARTHIHAAHRGYFTPAEDDTVRQMLLSYRNYRLALLNIIVRCMDYQVTGDPRLQMEKFMVGFAAGLTLYGKSLKLIQTYEHQPLIRQKLNEPEEKFGLAEGFFDEVLAAYSSLGNYRLLARGVIFWQRNRRRVRKLGLLQTPEGKHLADLIRLGRKVIRKRLLKVLLCRCRYDFRLFCQTTLRPVRRTSYAVKTALGSTFATTWLTSDYRPAITPAVLNELQHQLRPGDILLSRADEKLTAALLPGFWSHAAINLGTRADLAGTALSATPGLANHLAAVPENSSSLVVESVAPRCLVNSLEKSLLADHVLVLRPNISKELITDALREACAHLGKPYDFDFDFNVTNRIVCTEVVYRAYHGKGAIQFDLVKRLGRFTLSGNDIAHSLLDRPENSPTDAALTPVCLFTRTTEGSRCIPREEIIPALRAVREGRPVATYSITPPPRQYSPA